jgi:adenosylcobinamide kinase / adenosylcobinamide-phosphate guanylyltransferase
MIKCLYLGGARSGKSHLAQTRAQEFGQVVVIATAQGLDAEMALRIDHHRQSRPAHWVTLEEPLHLSEAIVHCTHSREKPLILVDCLTLWLSNWLCLQDHTLYNAERGKFLDVLTKLSAPILLVSNEVGQGLIAPTELGRQFVDEAGRLHQQVAALCNEVIWVAAGLPLPLKSPATLAD